MAVPGRKFVINLLADSKPAEKAFDKVGKAAGRLPGPVGLATAAIAASFVAVVAVVGKVTKELFDLGQEFDDVYDKIRIQTGATGDVLAALQDSFRAVAAVAPNEFSDIGIAVQELNTRLGLTGQPLEDLALQLLTVSRLMGGDVQTNVRNSARLFGDWGIGVEDQADTLDFFFKTSQASGMVFDELMRLVVQSGATFRNYGFSIEESATMMGRFEREGVNLETVMSGLREAQGKILKTGGDLPTMFRDIVNEVMTLESDTDALNLAMEYFGAVAGPDMFDTMRSGKLDVDALVAATDASGETIMRAAEDTDGFREAWQNFKNYIKLTLEPVALEVFKGLEGLIAELTPAVQNVVDAFEKDGLEGALEQLSIEWNKIYQEQIKPLFDRFLLFLNDVVKPLAIELGYEIGAGIASAMWNGFKNLVRSKLWSDEISDAVKGVDTGRIARDSVGIPDFVAPPTFTVPNPGRVPGPPALAPRRLRMFAEGGLVMSPTLGMVGEAGPEVVIPLDRFERDMGSKGGDIYITVTSADPQAVVEAIRRYTRANGPLGQMVRL